MPVIKGESGWGEDDDEKKGPRGTRVHKEFDCPDCNANNPCDPPIGPGDEVLCNYCGSSFDVREGSEGKLKFKSK